MRCLAVLIDIDLPQIDNVILWERDGLPVAMCYFEGKVVMSRALESAPFDEIIAEVRAAYGIPDGRVARIQEWMQINAN